LRVAAGGKRKGKWIAMKRRRLRNSRKKGGEEKAHL